jgi:hypothetical protein
MKNEAYWIDPDGTIIPLTADRHINEITNYPEKFGLTKEGIAAVYKKFNEPPGSEGKAREEIIFNLIKKGWIRIRYNSRGSFVIQVWKADNRTQDSIFDWAKWAVKKDGVHKFTDVTIMELNPRATDDIRGNMEGIVKYSIFPMNESKEHKKPLIVRIAEYISR